MKHLIFAVYVILFSSGFAGIAALAFLAVRTRSSLVRDLLGIQLMLLFGLVLVLVYFYLGNMISFGTRDATLTLDPIAFLSTGVQGLLYFFAWRLTGKLKGDSTAFSRLRSFTRILCLAVMISSFFRAFRIPLSLVFSVSLTDPFSSLAGAGYILVGTAILALALCLFYVPLVDETPAVRLLFRLWSYCLFAFLPLTLLEWFLGNADNPYKPLSLDFIFYLSCSVSSVVAFLYSMKDTVPPEVQVADVPVPDEVAISFGLTARERDMIPLIARGLANKEIAAELGISGATVRTHIYNLFRKVDARSRIELLNRIRDRSRL